MLKALLKGEVGLGFTYWVIFVGGHALIYISSIIIFRSMGINDETETVPDGLLDELFVVTIVLLSVSFFYLIFASCCTWRSAKNYSGAPAWSIIARIMVVVAWLRSFPDFFITVNSLVKSSDLLF
jgi:hypothetical protein